MSHILQRVAPIGKARDKEILKDAVTYAYQERPQGELQAHVFLPEHSSTIPRTVVVFFHGGFWDTHTPTQFVPHCLHFTSRGTVAIAAETRTQSNHGTGPLEAIEDARDLIRWLRHNAETFNIDPNKIVIGGAAGGALLGLMTSMPKSKHLPSVDGLDCHAQALIFFSALVDPVKNAQAISKFPSSSAAKQYSPARHIRRKLPPMLFFHGKSDRVTPFSDIERFCRRARFWGNRCQLIDFERADHSFFNFNVSHKNFELTIATADHFLVELGLLQPDETLGQD